jgi:hypothetical protein
MRYVRLKGDNAGESHFEQATLDLKKPDYRPPAPPLFVSLGRRPFNLLGYLQVGPANLSIHPSLNFLSA